MIVDEALLLLLELRHHLSFSLESLLLLGLDFILHVGRASSIQPPIWELKMRSNTLELKLPFSNEHAQQMLDLAAAGLISLYIRDLLQYGYDCCSV